MDRGLMYRDSKPVSVLWDIQEKTGDKGKKGTLSVELIVRRSQPTRRWAQGGGLCRS